MHTLEPPPRRGGSNEYPQCMFWSKIGKIGVPLYTPVFLYKSGLKGVYVARTCFPGDILRITIFSDDPWPWRGLSSPGSTRTER